MRQQISRKVLVNHPCCPSFTSTSVNAVLSMVFMLILQFSVFLFSFACFCTKYFCFLLETLHCTHIKSSPVKYYQWLRKKSIFWTGNNHCLLRNGFLFSMYGFWPPLLVSSNSSYISNVRISPLRIRWP
jgi:hypothetical protein